VKDEAGERLESEKGTLGWHHEQQQKTVFSFRTRFSALNRLPHPLLKYWCLRPGSDG
jgi:hypothetical protein